VERKYERVISYIEKLIANNELTQGERLPSIRELADKLKCNKATIIRAYKEMEINHRIYAIPKGGYYLVEKSVNRDECYSIIDFTEVLPDPKLLPYKEFNHCINKAVELYKSSLFTYGDIQGLESLRKVLVNHFSDQQVFAKEEKIFITNGSQQGLSILTEMSFSNGRNNVLVEQPTYSLVQRLVEINGDKLIGITRTSKGIDFNELEEIFKHGDIKFFYTIPRLHNPLGTSYTEKEKKKIIELAERYDVYIVEDDYLGDIDTDKKAAPIHYYDIWDRVIYVKGFSKTFMPGIRIGAVVLPEKLRMEFLKHKRCVDLGTAVLSQGALEIFISSGMYNKHIKKAQLEYRRKMDYVRELIKGIDTREMEINIPHTGFFIWIVLPDYANIKILERTLKDKRIHISSSKDFFIRDELCRNGIRLCISSLSKEQIRVGIYTLYESIRTLWKP
jgi:DNA-binding transcriptional MocR family regulator